MRHSSIADALFSRLQQQLLATLLLNPSRSWYSSELANHLGVQRSSLQRFLKRLVAAGIVKVSGSGNRTYYRADTTSPVFSELSSFLLKTVGLVDVIRERLFPLAKRICVAAVYGSIAKSAEVSPSDVDLLIIGDVKLFDLVPLLDEATRKLQREVNPTIYTAAEFEQKAKHSHFVKSLLAKPLLFVIGTRDALDEITHGKKSGGGTN